MRAVLFDLDGTLLRLERPYRELLGDAFRDVGIEPTKADLVAYESAFFDRFKALEDRPVERAFAGVVASGGADEFAAALLRREIEASAPPEAARADLERLADRFRLGVLTNGLPAWQRRKLEASGLAPFFDAIVTSYEAGAHKPEPAPFQLVEERLPAAGYGMVGDADADIDGATRVGWPSWRYQGGGFGALPDALGWPD